MAAIKSRAKILIVGGGFAGLAALHRLHHELGNNAAITLIDKSPHSVNRPMMPEIAFAGKPASHSLFPMSEAAVSADSAFLPGVVTAIDANQGKVHLLDGQALPYDYLILAPGPVHDYAAVPGLEAFGHSVCDETHAAELWRALKGFKGGNVVIGSAPTAHGTRIKAPVLKAACEGPVGEAMFMMDHLMRARGIRGTGSIRVFSLAGAFFEDVGQKPIRIWGL